MNEQQSGKKESIIAKVNTNRPRGDAEQDLVALVAAIRGGDVEAFGNFYRGYVDSLVTSLTRVLRNEEDAREITQDTFALLWENRATLDPHTSLNGYVTGMARNLAFRMLRDRCKGLDCNDLHMFQGEFAEFADDNIVKTETEIIVKNILSRMPAQRRRVFEMSRNEGLTYNEIAEKLNISYNTVLTHINLAKKEIRSALTYMLFMLFMS